MAKKILFLLVALSNIGVISLSVDIVVYLNGKRMLEMTTSVQQLEGTKRSVYLRESPKMMEEPRIEIVR